MESLWPDEIGKAAFVAPVTILKEQAKYLGERTNNIVVADVSPLTLRTNSASIAFGFYVEAPALSDYSFRLFAISHEPDPYPLIFHLDRDLIKDIGLEQEPGVGVIANDEEEFVEILGMVLRAEKTQRIISALLSQSTAFAEPAQPSATNSESDDDIPF